MGYYYGLLLLLAVLSFSFADDHGGNFTNDPLNHVHNESCHHLNHTDPDTSAEKVEQILWDIFVEDSEEEEEMSDDEKSELIYRHEDDSDDHHVSKRSVVNETERVARKSSSKAKQTKKSSASSKKRVSGVSKYNEYMDIVLKRMNGMIKTKNMDPLMVNLFSGSGDKNKNKNNKNHTKKKRKGAKTRARMDEKVEEVESNEEVELDNDHDGYGGGTFMRRDVFVGTTSDGSEEDSGSSSDSSSDSSGGFRSIRALILNGSMKRSADNPVSNSTVQQETRGFDSEKKKKKSGSATKKNNNKKADKKKKQATRGVLKGLSSLRRAGNVDVIKQSEKVRVVRAKFLLGPVTLEIVPKSNKESHKRKPKADEEEEVKPSKVTAVAQQLKGIIEVRLKKNSPTTIKRLRVFPPASVKIKSGSSSSSTTQHSSKDTKKSVMPRYSRVTPVATHRLRQIASAVVRQADVVRKSNGVEVDIKRPSSSN